VYLTLAHDDADTRKQATEELGRTLRAPAQLSGSRNKCDLVIKAEVRCPGDLDRNNAAVHRYLVGLFRDSLIPLHGHIPIARARVQRD
jgi:hypothetical protein